MGKNTGDNFRKGSVKDRSQVFNTKTSQYIKRDTNTGRFVSSKNTPYKGVRKEKSNDDKKKNL